MFDKNTIPEHWEVKKLGEVCLKVEKVKRKEKNLKEELIYLDIGGVNNKTNRITDYKTYNWETAPSRAQQIIYQGDILFSTVRTYLKNIAYVDKEIYNGQIASSGFCVIRANDEVVKSNFLFYLSLSHDFLQPLNELQTGSSYPAVRDKDVFSQLIPVPPLSEQQEIVAKIDELFSELDKGKEQLETARQQLKVYRQAVLKWAFEGKFTNSKVEDGELPGGWKWEKLGTLAEVKRGKSKHRPRNDKNLFGGPYPFIQTGEVRAANGGVIKSWSETYSEFGLQQSKLWPKGTLCLTIAANIAETAFLGFDACFPDSVVGIKANKNMLSMQFLNYCIQNLKREIDNKASATAQKNINVDFLEKLLIPAPPIAEQIQIIQEIESRLSVCDKVEETIAHSLQQAETLRQSILKKAFEGKLVKPSIPAPEVSYAEPFTIDQ